MKTLKHIWRGTKILLLVVLILCVGCNIITGIISGKSHIFGYKPMLIMSESMEPTLKTYQLVLTVPVDAADVKVGDIVTYKTDSGLTVIHRVIEVTAEGFVFKGDNNANRDEKVVIGEQIGYKVIVS